MTSRSILLHGPFDGHSSFALVNRRLAAGLTARGWQVTVAASDAQTRRRLGIDTTPDVYLFHGHPYDITNAPGRVNAFYLSYDYRRFIPADRVLGRRLNAWFDLVIVPSGFSRDACLRSGVKIPVHVCPYGVDFDEFRPDARPVSIPGVRSHCFLALGGATSRKGTDLVLDAYARAFTDADDVTLVVKASGYPHLRGWLDRRAATATRGRRAPHVVVDASRSRSVAGYFAAATTGIFPFRGEGFGLPILECLATGRPIIATRAGGPLDYGRVGVTWLPASPRMRRGLDRHDDVEPSKEALIHALRTAMAGLPAPVSAAEIRRSVSTFTWSRSAARLDALLRGRPVRRVRARSAGAGTAFFYFAHGTTSWRRVGREIDHALASSGAHRSHSFDAPVAPPSARIVVGQSGFALEAFTRTPAARRVLCRENGPLALAVPVVDRERRACGLAPPPVTAMTLWRDQREAALADAIVVMSRISRARYLAAGHAASAVHVVTPGVTPARRLPARRHGPTRLLFAASDPFRKGIRVLLEAWRLAAPVHAELWCVMSRDALRSPFVLRHLTTDARISVRPFTGTRGFLPIYEAIDVVVLPSFEDGFGTVVADGMARGRPAIVSEDTGISETIVPGESGLVVRTGSVAPLAEAIDAMCDGATRARLGDRAFETARTLGWAAFRSRFTAIVFAGDAAP